MRIEFDLNRIPNIFIFESLLQANNSENSMTITLHRPYSSDFTIKNSLCFWQESRKIELELQMNLFADLGYTDAKIVSKCLEWFHLK